MSQPPPGYGVTTPEQARNLRACMLCSILLPQTEFFDSGCPNCESVLQLSASRENINECTSSNFHGTIALIRPSDSWVAKWQRLDGYVQGLYAVQVIGTLPEDMAEEARSQGLRVVPRDGKKDIDTAETEQ